MNTNVKSNKISQCFVARGWLHYVGIIALAVAFALPASARLQLEGLD